MLPSFDWSLDAIIPTGTSKSLFKFINRANIDWTLTFYASNEESAFGMLHRKVRKMNERAKLNRIAHEDSIDDWMSIEL